MFYFCQVLLYSPFPDIAMTHYSEWSWCRWKVSFKKVWTFGVRGSVYQSVKGNFILGQHEGSCCVLWGPLFPVQGSKDQCKRCNPNSMSNWALLVFHKNKCNSKCANILDQSLTWKGIIPLATWEGLNIKCTHIRYVARYVILQPL